MAPGRRGRPAGSTKNKTSTSSSNPQQRISFGGPNAANKITKPSTLAGSGSNNAGKDGKKGKLSPSQQKVVKEVVELQQEEDEAEAQVVEEKEEATAAAATTAQEDQHLPLPQRHKHAARGPGPAPGPQAADPADETDALAAKVSEAQIRRFWAGKEASRIVGRVHQGGVGLHEKVLREWDLSSQFGVCHPLLPRPRPLAPFPFLFSFLLLADGG